MGKGSGSCTTRPSLLAPSADSRVVETERGRRASGGPARAPRRPTVAYTTSFERRLSDGTPMRVDLYRDVPYLLKADLEFPSETVTDLLEARLDGGVVGYVALVRSPIESIRQKYPDSVRWAAAHPDFRGSVRVDVIGGDPASWTPFNLQNAVRRYNPYSESEQHRAETRRRKGMSLDELRADYLRAYESESERFDRQYRRFLDTSARRAIIGNVRVGGIQRYDASLSLDRPHDRAEHRGRGIGRALYESAALWLDVVGVQLHASHDRSPSAVAVWDSFERRGITSRGESGKGRLRLEASTMLARDSSLVSIAERLGRSTR